MPASQVLVLGVHRSGTSLLTETAAQLGLHAGNPEDLDAGDRWNERGYWEHRGIRAVDEALLAACDDDWFGASGFDAARLPAGDAASLSERARALVDALDARAPWVAKDPRLCVLLPFWLPLLSSPAFLFSLRGPLSVARSLRARDGLPLPVGVAIWEVQLLSAIAATKGRPRAAFWYEDLVDFPGPETARLAAWLREEVGLPAAEANGVAVDPGLRHQVTDRTEEEARLPVGARRLAHALRTGEAFSDAFDLAPSEDAREIVDYVTREARTRRFLERGWRQQRDAHGNAVESLEGIIRLKDEYIADLRRHLGIAED